MKMNNEQLERAKTLAREHWSYIEKLLITHRVDTEIIQIIKFHYISSFIHGYKHAIEDK